MNVRGIYRNTLLPWTLIGMIAVYFLLRGIFWNISDCPAKASKYDTSTNHNHVTRHYYYDCGGATVGFSQFIDVDDHTVFSTYGEDYETASSKWISDTDLEITYVGRLEGVENYKAQFAGINIRLIHGIEPVTETEISAARKAAGY